MTKKSENFCEQILTVQLKEMVLQDFKSTTKLQLVKIER